MRIVILLGTASLAACSGSEHDGSDGESYNCADEERDDEFVSGLSKPGVNGMLAFEIVEAVPAPPSRGNNTWTVELTSLSSAAPVTDAAIVATPFMPEHEHGTPITVGIEPLSIPGQYKLTPVNLWMPGLWQTTLEAQGAGMADRAVCIPS